MAPPRPSRPSRSRRDRDLATLAEVARIASDDLELRPMLQRITNAIARKLGCELVALVRIERDANRFVCEAVTSSIPTAVQVGYSRQLGSGIVGRVAASGETLLLDDVANEEGYVGTSDEVRSELCVPIRHRDEVVAILNLESRRPGAFRGQVPLVQALADQLAGAIAGARHFDETLRRNAHLEILSEVSRTAIEAGELAGILRNIASYIRRRFDFFVVSIVLTDSAGEFWEPGGFSARDAEPPMPPRRHPIGRGVIGRAILSGRPQWVPEVAKDPDYVEFDPRVSAEFVVPIVFRGQALGAFNVESDETAALSADRRTLLELLADQLAGAIQLAVLNSRLAETSRELARANRALELASRSDPLTGVANRRKFDESLDLEWRRLIRVGKPLSLALVDVDCFKFYNDLYGHLAGDHALRQVAGALSMWVQRAGELVARYGGEEFALILPELESQDAVRLGERLRGEVQALAVPHAASIAAPVVTASIGLATCVPRLGLSPRELIRAADEALYRAKRLGRNRVEAGTVEE